MLPRLALLLILGWSSGASAVPTNNPITNGLVAAYEFSGNADDVSGNDNDGVVNGATPTADRFGNSNSAYSFDGNSVITLPSFENQLSAGFSFSAWVYQTSILSWAPVINKSNPSVHASPIHFSLGTFGAEEINQNNYLSLYISSDGSIVDRASRVGGPVPDAGAWLHVSGVYDPGTRQDLFVNGVLSNGAIAGTIQGSYLDGSHPFLIGQAIANTGTRVEGFQGFIDDVYIYNRALSPTEVSTLYSAVPEPSTGLLLSLGIIGMTLQRRRRGC
ncbi:PEP-CTERM sorting domain-containing protein [Myxococcota bacterium]|nr:PEP-CTERM sorting domain-containing protein [Myxococcota bacterium]